MQHLESKTEISASSALSHEKYASGELRLGLTALKVVGKNNHIAGAISTLSNSRDESSSKETGGKRGSRGGKKIKEQKNAIKRTIYNMNTSED